MDHRKSIQPSSPFCSRQSNRPGTRRPSRRSRTMCRTLTRSTRSSTRPVCSCNQSLHSRQSPTQSLSRSCRRLFSANNRRNATRSPTWSLLNFWLTSSTSWKTSAPLPPQHLRPTRTPRNTWKLYNKDQPSFSPSPRNRSRSTDKTKWSKWWPRNMYRTWRTRFMPCR